MDINQPSSCSPEKETQDNYLLNRLEKQTKWYGERSRTNKLRFLWLRVLQIFFASTIPFLAGYAEGCPPVQITVGVLGVAIAILSALDSLLKPQQLWVEYRTTAETLKHQHHLYSTGTAPYGGADAFNLLVENVETIISKENGGWFQSMNRKSDSGLTHRPT